MQWPVFLAGGATVAATLIHTPKNGACIAADMSLDNNNTLKFGANIPTKLLIIKSQLKSVTDGGRELSML